jgi:uncharacterized protein (TIGR02145 family)
MCVYHIYKYIIMKITFSVLLAGLMFSFVGCKNQNEMNVIVPGVTIEAVTDITATTAVGGGEIKSDGGAAVTSRGICWGTNQYPTTSDSITSVGTGTGSFTSSLTGLTPGTTYYLRAYANNAAGTDYSGQEIFTTLALAPVLTTALVLAVTSTSASSGGNITNDGGSAVTARGVCWSTNHAPTIADSKNIYGTGAGSFTSFINGLTPNTVFYLRAYATNTIGTSYGNELSFKTSVSDPDNGIIFNPTLTYGLVTDIEGNVYKTIQIGTQTWMAENLKTTKYRNGDPIPHLTDNSALNILNPGAYFWYNNDITNRATYGALYNWYAATDGRNIAPAGWHVPTDGEVLTLMNYLGGGAVAGGKLKESGTTHWASPNIGATNESGFTALPGGARSGTSFYSINGSAYLWSSSQPIVWYWYMYSGDWNLYRDNGSESDGYSVRCVKN